ncbi:MAG: restriction endonuclease subunit S [Symplocastrum torsivum CPER-KK1]|uniref:Restriction endonuclease subunit S n=1 Tax=Symplocastrum torsivum CPER-KK1 TaxID=450513 RepID=A0A951PSL9_9CYAN|nr:restriction endonuclease subunit S [Symplocastrum torsivum CPER-KK1]
MITTELISQQEDKRELPDGWRWVKLGDVCEIVMGQSPVGTSYNSLGKGEPLLNGPSEFGSVHPTPVQWTTDPTRFAEPEDILFCVRGATTGRKNIADQRYCIGRGLAAIRGKSGQAINEFLFFLLDAVTSTLLRETAGSTFPNLPGEKLERFKILLPPFDEQKRIAAILNEQMEAVERSRQATLAQLEAAIALPAAYLRAVFNSPEAQKWERKQLGELAQFKNGINFTGDQKGQGTLTVDVLNMYSDSVYIQMDKLYRVDIRISDEYLLHPQDILFVRSSVKEEGVAWSACFSEYTEPITFCGFLIRARLIEANIHPEFLIYYLRQDSLRSLLISKSGRGTITNINQENLKTVTVPTPPLAVQKRITATLTEQLAEVEHLQKSLKYQLDAINKLPATLLRRAFNGEL